MGSPDTPTGAPGQTARPTIVYRKLEEARLEETVSLFIDNFFPYNRFFNTLVRLTGGQSEDNRGWLAAILATWPWEGCLLAVDAATDRVVGASLSVITQPDSPEPFQPFLAAGTEVATLFTQIVHELEGDYDVFKALDVKRVLYRVATTVDIRYCRLGIAGELFRRTTHETAGCEAVIGISASNFTERCWRKLHYQEIGRVDLYQSSAMAANPRIEVERCGEHKFLVAMVLKLSA